jgi:hypothetical protein
MLRRRGRGSTSLQITGGHGYHDQLWTCTTWSLLDCVGFYDAGTHLALPDGLVPLLNPNWLVLTIARHLEGTCYNEFIIGALVRRAVRAGIHLHAIWVDEEASLWGGRHIWGIPKERATFVWNTDTVRTSRQRAHARSSFRWTQSYNVIWISVSC